MNLEQLILAAPRERLVSAVLELAAFVMPSTSDKKLQEALFGALDSGVSREYLIGILTKED